MIDRLPAFARHSAELRVEHSLDAQQSDDVVDLLRRTRARADRRALAESFRARLRTRPMAAMVAPLLDALERQPSSPSWRTVRGLAVEGAGGLDLAGGSAPAKPEPFVGTACARGGV